MITKAEAKTSAPGHRNLGIPTQGLGPSLGVENVTRKVMNVEVLCRRPDHSRKVIVHM